MTSKSVLIPPRLHNPQPKPPHFAAAALAALTARATGNTGTG
ncbi:hypothetical protein [Arthrobacter agilis]|nr:hypothetical protein [Arthrobacter agilis]